MFSHIYFTPVRVALTETIMHILESQYVRDDVSGRVFSVGSGSGMGQILSGDVSDLVCWDLCEAGWASRADIQAAYGVHLYVRYRDDILIIYSRQEAAISESTGLSGFIRGMKERAGSVYEIELESVAPSCQYLDIEITRASHFMQSGKVSWAPYRKPTAHKIPLHSSSGHHRSVHRSWPIGEILRTARRSDSQRYFLCLLLVRCG